jgi:hypothetical protein
LVVSPLNAVETADETSLVEMLRGTTDRGFGAPEKATSIEAIAIARNPTARIITRALRTEYFLVWVIERVPCAARYCNADRDQIAHRLAKAH